MKFWGEFNEGAIYKVWVSKPVRNVQAPGLLREETNTTPSPEETRGGSRVVNRVCSTLQLQGLPVDAAEESHHCPDYGPKAG